MINAHRLGCHIGRQRLLEDVSFSVQPGSCVAVVGANGAGKSTLLRLLSGEYFARRDIQVSGTADLAGQSLAAWSPQALAQRRSMLMQSHADGLALSVRDLVALGAYPHGGLRQEQQGLRDGVLAQWQLGALAGRSGESLSGGERQRAQLARTDLQLALHPQASERLWLLDEPLNSLDLPHQQLLRRQMRARASAGALVLFSVHDLNFALRTADTVLALRAGRLLYAGGVRELAVPEKLFEIFDTRFVCLEHPHDGLPLVLPA